MAAFVMQYTDSPGSATKPACELRFTMRPPPWRIISRPTGWRRRSAFQIHRAGEIKVRLGYVRRRVLGTQTSVIDKDIDATELGHQRLYSAPDLVQTGHVHLKRNRSAPHLLDCPDEVVGT